MQFLTSTSPVEDSTFTVADVNGPTTDSPQFSHYSLGFTNSSRYAHYVGAETILRKRGGLI